MRGGGDRKMTTSIKIQKSRVAFGLALSDSMFSGFSGQILLRRTPLFPVTVKSFLEAKELEQISICNPSHEATIRALDTRFGIKPQIPEKPPKFIMDDETMLIVAQVQGLPRLTDRHEYTLEEINSATFSFSCWEVI